MGRRTTGHRGASRGKSHTAPVRSGDVVAKSRDRDRLQEALDEVWRAKPITKVERKWADRLLEAGATVTV